MTGIVKVQFLLVTFTIRREKISANLNNKEKTEISNVKKNTSNFSLNGIVKNSRQALNSINNNFLNLNKSNQVRKHKSAFAV